MIIGLLILSCDIIELISDNAFYVFHALDYPQLCYRPIDSLHVVASSINYYYSGFARPDRHYVHLWQQASNHRLLRLQPSSGRLKATLKIWRR